MASTPDYQHQIIQPQDDKNDYHVYHHHYYHPDSVRKEASDGNIKRIDPTPGNNEAYQSKPHFVKNFVDDNYPDNYPY